MELKFDRFDFPIEIPVKGVDKRNLTVRKYDIDHDMAFRIEMDGKTLVLVHDNGDIELHISDYAGRDYHYEQRTALNKEDALFVLVPTKKEEN